MEARGEQKYVFLEEFLTKIEKVTQELDMELRLIEIKETEGGSEINPTSNQVVEEMLCITDLYLTKIRSFVSSGRDILNDIQNERTEMKSNLENYKSSFFNAIVKLQEAKKNSNALSKELDLKKVQIENLHSKMGSLKQEIENLKGTKIEEKIHELEKKLRQMEELQKKNAEKLQELQEKNTEISMDLENQKSQFIKNEEESKKREIYYKLQEEFGKMVNFIFNLESSLKSKMKFKNNVKFTLTSIFYNKKEERKTFEKTLKDLNFSEYFDFEEQVVNLIKSIKNGRLPFDPEGKSFLKHEDLYAIMEGNCSEQKELMKAFDILLKLDKIVGKNS